MLNELNYIFEVLKGKHALIRAILESIDKVKSSIVICLPKPISEVVDALKLSAAQNKTIRLLVMCDFKKKENENSKKDLKSIKNIQLRNFDTNFSFKFCSLIRDTEEIIMSAYSENDEELIGFCTNHPIYSKLYSQVIGPVFIANSRPIK